MPRFEFCPVGHHLDDDRGARHCQCRPKYQAGLPGDVPTRAHQCGDVHQYKIAQHRAQYGDENLRCAKAEDLFAHVQQFGQVEFEPNHEH